MNPRQELAALEQLLDELLRGIQDILQAGEVLSDEFQGMLAQELDATTTRIDQLREEIGQGAPTPPTPTPPLEPGAYPSSNVNSYKYNPNTGELFVKFHGKESPNSGPTYRYTGIPLNIYDVFSHGRVAPKTSGQNRYHRWIRGVTPSLGASLYALIREGGFPYQRLS